MLIEALSRNAAQKEFSNAHYARFNPEPADTRRTIRRFISEGNMNLIKKISAEYRAFSVWLQHIRHVVTNEARHVAAVEALRAEHAANLETLKAEHSRVIQTLRDELTSVKEYLTGELTAFDAWALSEISRKYGPETRPRADKRNIS